MLTFTLNLKGVVTIVSHSPQVSLSATVKLQRVTGWIGDHRPRS